MTATKNNNNTVRNTRTARATRTPRVAVDLTPAVALPRTNQQIFHDVAEITYNDRQARIANVRESHVEVPGRTIEVAGHIITIREKSVVINDDGKFGGAIELHKQFETAGALSALSAIHTNPATGRYAIMEVGFVQYFSDEELRARVREPRAAVVTASYNGNDPRILAVRPAVGVSLLSYRQGAFIVARNTPAMPKWSEQNEREMQFFAKHDAMDMILAGRKIFVAPFLQDHKLGQDGRWATDVNGEFEYCYNEAKTTAMIATYTGVLFMTPENAAVQVEQNIKRAGIRESDKKLYHQARALVSERPELAKEIVNDGSLKVDGIEHSFKSLLGREVTMYIGSMPVGNKTVTLANAPELFMQSVQGRMFTFKK